MPEKRWIHAIIRNARTTHLNERAKAMSNPWNTLMFLMEAYHEETHVFNVGSARRSGGHDCRVHLVFYPESLIIATDEYGQPK
jgi:hypothetical protein